MVPTKYEFVELVELPLAFITAVLVIVSGPFVPAMLTSVLVNVVGAHVPPVQVAATVPVGPPFCVPLETGLIVLRMVLITEFGAYIEKLTERLAVW